MTVHEIAALAGVSIGTVDRVLHKRGRVSADTVARVEKIIKQYGFTPNPIARRLKRGRTYHFCVLIPRRDQDAGYWGQIAEGVERAAADIKSLGVYTEIIEYDRYDPGGFQQACKTVFARKLDGLVFAPIMQKRTRSFVEKALAEKTPLVFVDSDMPGVTPLCAVGQDSFSGGYLAGRLFHLFTSTVSMPAAILNAHGDDYNIMRRRDGFLSYAKENGFPVIVREYSDNGSGDIPVEEIVRFLEECPGLSGMFITNCMAFRAAEAAEHSKIKDPFTLVGYDLIPSNRTALINGRINAIISQRSKEQGREALLTLFRSVVLEQPVEARREMPLNIYIRENTLNE